MKYKIKKMAVVCSFLVCCTCALLSGCTSEEELIVYQEDDYNQEPEDTEVTTLVETPEQLPEEPTTIYIHVCGAVKQAGVYELPSGSRVFEAVNAAGGFSEDADTDYMNQAETVVDGMKIQIPTKEQAKQWAEVGDPVVETEEGSTDGKVNINLADEAALCAISGVGQGRAKAIIAYREAHGGFSAIEDIMKVDGIKNATFEKLKDQICVK